jgi:hypothetical protein
VWLMLRVAEDIWASLLYIYACCSSCYFLELPTYSQTIKSWWNSSPLLTSPCMSLFSFLLQALSSMMSIFGNGWSQLSLTITLHALQIMIGTKLSLLIACFSMGSLCHQWPPSPFENPPPRGPFPTTMDLD